MITPFCGPDCAGKSYLLNKFIEYRESIKKPIPYVPQDFKTGISTLEGNSIEHRALLYIKALAPLSQYDFVVDRFLLSNLVYCKVFKRDYDLSYHQNIIADLIRKGEIAWVYVRSDVPWKRNEEFVTPKQRKELLDEYDAQAVLLKERGARIITVQNDPPGHSPEKLKKLLEDLDRALWGWKGSTLVKS